MKLYKLICLSGIVATTILGVTSCKKDYLETRPTNQAELEEVFTTTQGARSVINGIHRRLFESDDHNQFSLPSINLTYELMSDDLGLQRIGAGWFVGEARYNTARDGAAYTWSVYYAVVNNANFVLQYIDDAIGSETDKNEIKAQAYSLRAFAYLQLIQTYQYAFGSSQYVVAPSGTGRIGEIRQGATPEQALGVPIYTGPTKEGVQRASMRQVLDRIDTDLDSSMYYFNQGTPNRSDKSQININVAHGLKARSDLFQHRWTQAVANATAARQGFSLSQGAELLDGFNNVNNKEWIWGSVINAEQNGIYASWMSHMDPRLDAYATMAERIGNVTLLRAASGLPYSITLDSNDVRFFWFNGYNNATKTRPELQTRSQLKFYAQSPSSFVADYPLMRVAEMYLIEAEAKAMSNDVTGAKDVLLEYGLTRNELYSDMLDTIAVNKDRTVQEIWRQRRLELWGEGFRFFDCKRQFVSHPGVTPLDAINRSRAGFPAGVISSQMMIIEPTSNFLNFRLPGGELQQNREIYQNP